MAGLSNGDGTVERPETADASHDSTLVDCKKRWGPLKRNREPIAVLDCHVPGVAKESMASFLDFFDSIDWSSTVLGPRDEWSDLLKSMTSLMLLSPIPILMTWGPDLLVLHNEPFAREMKCKATRMLGRPYEEAFSELRCSSTAMQIRNAYLGQGSRALETLMWLKRGHDHDRADEMYVSYHNIPIRDADGVIQGVWIPNVDASESVFMKRRMRILNDLTSATANSHNYQDYWTRVAESLRKENTTNYLPSIAIYSNQARSEEFVMCQGQKWPACKEDRFDRMRRRESESASSSAGHMLELVVRQNVPSAPMSVSHRVIDADMEAATTAEELLEAVLEHLDTTGDDYVTLDLEQTRLLHGEGARAKTIFDDEVTHALVFGTRQTAKSQVNNLFVVGASTRHLERSAFVESLRLLATTIADGLAPVQLFLQQLDQAHYRAWLANQQRVEMEQALERRTQELLTMQSQRAQVMSVLPCGLWRADSEGNILDTNPAWIGMTNIEGKPTQAALVAKIDREYRKPFMTFWNRHVQKNAIRPGSAHGSVSTTGSKRSSLRQANESFLFKWDEPDELGHSRWAECILIQEFDQDAQLEWIIGTLNDVSERVRAEEYQNQRANDANERRNRLNRFVDILSHELRNPMSAISSCVELALDRLHHIQHEVGHPTRNALDECVADMDTVSFCLNHMKRLVDDTLNLSRLEHDFLILDLKPFKAVDLINDAVRMFSAEHERRQVKCEIELCDQVKGQWLVSDPAKVLQIFINLLGNSSKLCHPEHPVIRITGCLQSSQPTGEHWRLSDDAATDDPTKHLQSPEEETAFLVVSVHDNGPGFSEQDKEAMFEKFDHGALTGQYYGGSGMALYICRRMAEMLGGACGLESVQGNGSTFSFCVQVNKTTQPPSLPPSKANSPVLGSARDPALPRRKPTLDSSAAKRRLTRSSTDFVSPSSPQLDSYRIDGGLPALPSSGVATPTTFVEQEAVSRSMQVVAMHSPTSEEGQHRSKPPTPAQSPGPSPLDNVESCQPEPLRVLLVEDNVINARLLEKQLSREGFVVTCADNGRVCLERLEPYFCRHRTPGLKPNDYMNAKEGRKRLSSKRDFDVVLMDIEMPLMNGLEATARIRESERELSLDPMPIIGVTANARAEQVEEMLSVGADDVQVKPFKIKALVDKITELAINKQ